MADKQLKIKASSCSRLQKEVAFYEREVVEQRDKVARLVAEGKDEHDIKQQQEVLLESEQVLPDSYRRLERALQDLDAAIAAHDGDTADAVVVKEKVEAFLEEHNAASAVGMRHPDECPRIPTAPLLYLTAAAAPRLSSPPHGVRKASPARHNALVTVPR
eukprot:CAMPEP_0114622268 /NCGR_PEP_ID=MMETSP0168-20121206/9653_1 /TAXON_ID=95228 ORGANISM="Vannella sp., Strain DIVA3 517/6/12" /NCGR_SAMPLE_ID=MMETSP0168 /ASSEMBLY_ACC=CAM_ASM_000044 /LENGTH=159 /DNA_ID=CAMNT_0001833485 /DNA_START=28 /DNA_END=503 /DNA_ORIENTATION=-